MKQFNRRGEVNIFNVLFVALIFVIMMFLGVGKMINTMVGIGVVAGGVTGVEAFLLNNFILWILFAFIVWFMIAMSST